MTTRRGILILVALALMLAAPTTAAVAAPDAYYYGCTAYYSVKFGDTLSSVSQLYGVSAQALMGANNIYNANLIYAGQTLCIPGNAPVPSRPPCGSYYTIQWGDTLSSIAARYSTTMQAIMSSNNIYNPNFIYAGMILYVPCYGTRPQPSPAPSFPQWKGEYFNNPDLAGAPSFVRNDFAIAFNWGWGWPDPRISADNFSVRWTRTLSLREGVYRFTVNVDDGARLWIDNVLLLDQWHMASGQAYVIDVPLGAGNHVVRMEYYEATGAAFAFLSFQKVSAVPPVATPIPGQPPTPPTSGTSGGAWTCIFYSNMFLDGVVGSAIEPAMNFNWGGDSPFPGVPRNLWSMRCTSTQFFASSGLYQFNAQVDDGARVFVDGNAVISAWTNHAGTTEVGTANLSAGAHIVTVEYYQFGHDSLLAVWWNLK